MNNTIKSIKKALQTLLLFLAIPLLGQKNDMVLVEGGTFLMGSPKNEADRSEQEYQHKVKVDSFYICNHEVTQKEWETVMGTTIQELEKKENYTLGFYGVGENFPVYYVSWFDAIDFCNKLSQKEGFEPVYSIIGEDITVNWNAKGYRLPTEAEWEYAARGGKKSKGFLFSGSNDIDQVAWCDGNSDDEAHPVKGKEANELGIYDMTGNVWEWIWDWKNFDYYKESPLSNPHGPSTGSYKVRRGGSYYTLEQSCRSAKRNDQKPHFRSARQGFRLVRSF
jgi:formylglycine-generating enzyme required for sulfatase activity